MNKAPSLGNKLTLYYLNLNIDIFELGDKPDKLLARQLKGEQATRALYKIKSRSGDMITDLKEIDLRNSTQKSILHNQLLH